MNSLVRGLIKTWYRLILKVETPFDIVHKILIYIRSGFSRNKAWKEYGLCQERMLIERHICNEPTKHLDFRGVKLPLVAAGSPYSSALLWAYYDSILFYEHHNDNFEAQAVDTFEKYFESEGLYCYSDSENKIDMTVKAGDVVVDAGAWIGPFSAYAAHKGVQVYAFEPSPENQQLLKITAELNGSIEIVPFALYDKVTELTFTENNVGSKVVQEGAGIKVTTTTLDDFARSHSLKRIDFIKSDIEGAERNMLKGATWVLQNFAPKLSLCTYHYKEDPELLASIILAANPRYKIMQRKMKLFAWVPHE